MAAWCCKGSVLGRKPEHETLCFFVHRGCRRRWKVPRLCGGWGGSGCGRFIVFFLPQCNGGFKLPWVCLCVRSYRVFWNLCLQIALEWLHDVARALFWGGSRSTKPCVFPCKVAAGDDERYLVCAAGAAAVGLSNFFLPQCNGGFKLLWVCLCVRSYRVFWNLCLQIALEWLHDVARALFWGGSCCVWKLAV